MGDISSGAELTIDITLAPGDRIVDMLQNPGKFNGEYEKYVDSLEKAVDSTPSGKSFLKEWLFQVGFYNGGIELGRDDNLSVAVKAAIKVQQRIADRQSAPYRRRSGR